MEAATTTEKAPEQAAPPPRLRERYEDEVLPALMSKFSYSTRMQAPRLLKITLNMGVGDAKQDSKVLDAAREQLATIAGQQPNIRQARKSVANFKLREGMPVGVSVTLRRARMWEFLDRLTSIAVPRIRDFRGLNPRSFDGRGNYTIGVREQLIFPEIDYDSVDQTRGLDITITTTAQTDEEAFELLLGLGMPFAQEGRPGSGDDEARRPPRRSAARRRPAPGPRPRQAALEQLKEENPEAYEKPVREDEEEGEEGEGGETSGRRFIFRLRRERGSSNGQDFTASAAGPQVEVQDARLPSVSAVRSPARLLPQVWPLPHLSARGRPQGLRARNDQVELVAARLKN